jgi:hypothetical protein
LLRRIVWWKFTDVSEVLAASIIRAMKPPAKEENIILLLLLSHPCEYKTI